MSTTLTTTDIVADYLREQGRDDLADALMSENHATPRVVPMLNSSGKAVPNQNMIEQGFMLWFQSYDTIIARKNLATGEVVLDPEHGCSRTTARYRNIFLNADSAQVKAKIKDGTYKVANLN